MIPLYEGKEVFVETAGMSSSARQTGVVVTHRKAMVAETPSDGSAIVMVRWQRHAELWRFGRFAPMAVPVSRNAICEIQSDGKREFPATPPYRKNRATAYTYDS